MAHLIQAVLFDSRCWSCGSRLSGQRDFCFPCRREFFRLLGKEGFLLRHEGAAKGVLACLRGKAPRAGADWCLALLEKKGQIALWRKEGLQEVVVAPQNPKREESGLAIAAAKIGQALGIPMRRPFVKIGGRSQHGRLVSSRMDAPCFVRMSGRAKGKVLLIDDVCTTGTTLDICAYLLRKAGAEEVICYSLAHQMVKSLERQKSEAREESGEVNPLLLHLFV